MKDMPSIPTQAPDEHVLLDSIAFFRRMGNYLFLPFFIVFGFCTAVLLGTFDGPIKSLLESRLFTAYACLTFAGFAFWRLSRKPRPPMLFAVGTILAILDLIWASRLLYLLATGQGKVVALRWSYALVVLVGMGGASLKCFRLWRLLRSMDRASLEVAIRNITERN
jgi:hypothetical protein